MPRPSLVGGAALEEEVVEREALKKQSGTILDRATKGRKKKRGGKKEAS